jgi:hypothetical protein
MLRRVDRMTTSREVMERYEVVFNELFKRQGSACEAWAVFAHWLVVSVVYPVWALVLWVRERPRKNPTRVGGLNR